MITYVVKFTLKENDHEQLYIQHRVKVRYKYLFQLLKEAFDQIFVQTDIVGTPAVSTLSTLKFSQAHSLNVQETDYWIWIFWGLVGVFHSFFVHFVMCSFAEEPILHVISVSKFGPSCFYFLRVLQTHTSLFSLHGELACRKGFRSEMEALCMQTCFGCRFCRVRPRSLIYISTCIFPPKCVV